MKPKTIAYINIRDGTPETNSHWSTPYHQHKHRPILTVDFDHTITKTCPACPDWNGTYILQNGVREALEHLSKTFDIVILSGGGYYVKNYKETIQNFLEENKIPFDRILDSKPPATFMVDDRAIHHLGWASTMEEIKRRLAMNAT